MEMYTDPVVLTGLAAMAVALCVTGGLCYLLKRASDYLQAARPADCLRFDAVCESFRRFLLAVRLAALQRTE